MKKKNYLIGLWALLSLSLVSLNAQTPYFYYYGGEKQYFELDTRYIFVSIANEQAASELEFEGIAKQSLLIDIPETIETRIYSRRFWAKLSIENHISEETYLAKLAEIKNSNEELIVAPYFKNQYQDKIGLSNFFYVKLKSMSDTILLKQKTEKEDVMIVYQNPFMPLWFVLSVTKSSLYNSMEMANHFYESKLFQYAEPDLMVDDKLNCTNDTHINSQWSLKNTGQYGGINGVDIKICDAWQIATGSHVIVAVLDDGIELNHPDLVANIHPFSFDSENLTSPQVIKGNHGTACAGIIGAVRNNSKGIAGVAPNCKLMSISNSLAATTLSRERRANGMNWAWQNGAHVISNSWGSSVHHQVIDDAISNAVTQGRGGKGCVVVFASGNNNASTVGYPASLSNVIAVGAISPCGQRKSPSSCDGEGWGSNYGSALDVVAPGVLVATTDRQGNAGYNPNTPIHTSNGGNKITMDFTDTDYTVWFNGTSAACPFVAGVAALVLSVNPNLSGQQVRNIIESTAQKVRTDLYSYSTTKPNGTWNHQVGYGLVNAYAAVCLASCTAVTNFTNQTVNSSQTVTNCFINANNVTVTNNAKLILNAVHETTITGPFEVQSGSELEVKFYKPATCSVIIKKESE
jgi:subtilisin family serine protease